MPSAATVSTTMMCHFSAPVLRITRFHTNLINCLPWYKIEISRSFIHVPDQSSGKSIFSFLFAASVGMMSFCLQVQQAASVIVTFLLLV